MMKTLLLLLITLFYVNCYSQKEDTTYLLFYEDSTSITYLTEVESTYIDEEKVPYIVGSNHVDGYKVESKICDIDEVIVLPNGRRVAGINYILNDKDEYIGGNLVFKNDTTKITNVELIPEGEGARFIITGKDFNMEFTLTTGEILRLEDSYAVFNTKDKGIWTIKKG